MCKVQKNAKIIAVSQVTLIIYVPPKHTHTIPSLRVSESVTQLLWALNSLIFNATSSKQSHFFYLMCVWGLLIQTKETTAYFRCVCGEGGPKKEINMAAVVKHNEIIIIK